MTDMADFRYFCSARFFIDLACLFAVSLSHSFLCSFLPVSLGLTCNFPSFVCGITGVLMLCFLN